MEPVSRNRCRILHKKYLTLYGVVVSMTGKEIRITSTYGRGHRFWSYCIHIALIRYPPMVVKSRSQITFQCGLLWKALDGDGDINTSDSLRACMQQEGNRRGKSVRSLLSVVRRVCRAVASSAACWRGLATHAPANPDGPDGQHLRPPATTPLLPIRSSHIHPRGGNSELTIFLCNEHVWRDSF